MDTNHSAFWKLTDLSAVLRQKCERGYQVPLWFAQANNFLRKKGLLPDNDDDDDDEMVFGDDDFSF